MQRFWWPGYELQLLTELQRQQHSTQYCDTLLQTEGISIPTHSCVLAALSPYLSEKLSASPSPPSGQKRQLKLHNVKGKTLVKLVGLLYSGVLEVKGIIEKNDVLAAADIFGITGLKERQKDAEGMKEGDCKSIYKENGSRKMQDAQVQVEMTGGTVKDCEVQKKSCVSVGTQTVSEKCSSDFYSGHNNPTHSNPEPSGPHSLNLSLSLEPRTNTSNGPFVSTPRSIIPTEEESITNPTSGTTLSNDEVSVSNESSFPQEDSINQDLSKSDDRIQERTDEENRGDTELQGQTSRDETERREMDECSRSELKKQAGETTQISVKVKLRRRKTEGEVWEVVSKEDTDETFSVLASLKQDSSMNKRPQTDGKKVPLPASTPHQAAAFRSSDQLPPLSCTGVSFTSTQTAEEEEEEEEEGGGGGGEEEEAPALPQGSVEESDEQIGKMLDDIMRGLNILSDGAANMCQAPEADEGQHHPAGRCDFCQSDESTTDTGIHCCFSAPTQPTSVSLPALPSDVILQQQQHCSAWYNSSDRSLNFQGKLHYPQFQEAPSHEDHHILQLLPLSNGNDTNLDQFPLPCMNDFHLPPCLSPLKTCTSVTTQQLHVSSGSQQQQPWQQRRPWLTENPGSLTFPLSSSRSKQCQGHMERNPKNVGYCEEREDLTTKPRRKRKRNVQVKETSTSTSKMPRSILNKKRERNKTKSPEEARTRTRSLVNNTDILGHPAVLIPVIHRAKIVDTQGVCLPKNTCGQGHKNPPEEGVHVDKDHDEDVSKETETEKTSRRCEKRRRSTSEVELKSSECTTEAENKNDTEKVTSPKRPKTVCLKDFQKLIYQRHNSVNATKDKENQDESLGGEMETSRNESTKEKETDGDHVVFSLDENHNKLLDTNNSADENPGFSFDALEEEVAKLSMMKRRRSHDEGGSDPHHHNLNPQICEKTGSPVLEADDISRTSGCVQEEEEKVEVEQEEEDVDILLYSPEKNPQGQTCEFGLNSEEMAADEEEEEEEVNDVDVTGDETE